MLPLRFVSFRLVLLSVALLSLSFTRYFFGSFWDLARAHTPSVSLTQFLGACMKKRSFFSLKNINIPYIYMIEIFY